MATILTPRVMGMAMAIVSAIWVHRVMGMATRPISYSQTAHPVAHAIPNSSSRSGVEYPVSTSQPAMR